MSYNKHDEPPAYHNPNNPYNNSPNPHGSPAPGGYYQQQQPMGYGQGQYPQGGGYPQPQPGPGGYYQQGPYGPAHGYGHGGPQMYGPPQQRQKSGPGMLEACLAGLACCCCLDLLC
ncbi:hypothetical protein B0J18DRAFT_406854 [Chaetomium sp. MPI-SDFR-AT-0129]|nr:hypothetical protein B0J18DRAFT_406854 [Chaetomium sp. MPI-SDFR-AT-0129]